MRVFRHLIIFLALSSSVNADWNANLNLTFFASNGGFHVWQSTNAATGYGHYIMFDSFQPGSENLTNWSLLSTNVLGSSGTNGVNGIDGTNGVNGEQGIQGVDGADGTNGVNGVSGTNEVNGVSGTNGVNGSQGIQGVAGTNGVNGVSGTNGVNGISGTNGVNGTSGTNGVNGATVTIVRATNNIVNTNVTFVNATNLTFAVAAGVNYQFRFVVHYTTAATTTGIRFGINGPASQTALRVGGIMPTATAAMTAGSQTAYDTALFANTAGPGSTAVTGVIEGVFRNGANAGTLALRVASEIGLSAVTILAESHGEVVIF